MSPGSATSPTSRPVRAGCTWPPCSTSAPAGCWATRWPSTCAPSSSPTPSRWPPAPGAAPPPGSSSTATGAANISRASTASSSPISGCVQSVGRTGVCWDNSVAESFWSSLKRELVHRYRFPDRAARPAGDLRLDQPLQPPAAPLEPRLPPARRMGEQLPSSPGRPGRVTNVTGQRGDAQSTRPSGRGRSPPLPNLIGRRFAPGRPDVAWIGDITDIRPARAGCICPRCSKSAPPVARLLDGRAHVHRAGRRRAHHGRRGPGRGPTGSSSMATVQPIPVQATTASSSPISRCASPSDAPACARTTRWPSRLVVAQAGARASLPVPDRATARRAIFAWIDRYKAAGCTPASATSHPWIGEPVPSAPGRPAV